MARSGRDRGDRRAVLALGPRRRRLRARSDQRETLARALATPRSRERFTQRYGIDDAELARAVRAGLLRAVDDAERAGALSPLLGGPLREALRRIPLDQAIELIDDARTLLDQAQTFLGPAQGLLEQFLP